MRGQLHPTTVYLDELLLTQIQVLSATSGTPKAALIRTLLHKGLHALQVPQSSARSLRSLVGSLPAGSGLPKDLAAHHDRYAWEE